MVDIVWVAVLGQGQNKNTENKMSTVPGWTSGEDYSGSRRRPSLQVCGCVVVM